MSLQECVIVESAAGWHLFAGSQSEQLAHDVSVDELVTCLGLMLKLAGLTDVSCLIAPASTSCFFTRLPAGSDLDVHDRNALRFELESHLPLDAESMVADFVVTSGSGERVSAVAIECQRWKKMVDALESQGIAVRSIVPAALLTARVVEQAEDINRPTELFIIEGSLCDALTIDGGATVAWKHLELDPAILTRHRLLDSPGVDHILVAGLQNLGAQTDGDSDNDQRDTLASALQTASIRYLDRPLQQYWLEGAHLAITKPTSRWFELRRDLLAPGDPLRAIAPHLRLVAIAAGLCLLAIAIGGWWRSRRIDQSIQSLNDQQRLAFQAAFPSTPVPAALVRRVRSEHAKLSSSRGVSAEIEVPPAATEVLRRLLIAFPQDIRFHISSLKVAGGRVDLNLQVRTAVDAGNLAMALTSHGFEVDPPVTTRKDATSFDSVLKAKWRPLSPPNGTSPVDIVPADSVPVESMSVQTVPGGEPI